MNEVNETDCKIEAGNKGKVIFTYPEATADIIADNHSNKLSIQIPLLLENYGFPDERSTDVKPPAYFPLKLTQSSEELLTSLFSQKSTSLNLAMETVSKAVNDSFEYAVSGAVLKMWYGAYPLIVGFGWREYHWKNGEGSRSIRPISDFIQSVEKSGYTPIGNETVCGVCTDAGFYIRELLKQTIEDPKLRFAHVATKWEKDDSVGGHDTTLVFDIETGKWIVINSKSPTKFYNLTPKEKLHELGYPWRID